MRSTPAPFRQFYRAGKSNKKTPTPYGDEEDMLLKIRATKSELQAQDIDTAYQLRLVGVLIKDTISLHRRQL